MGAQPDQSQIVAGPGLIMIAPLGTTLPTLTLPLVWPSGWFAVGYTDAGIDAIYTPTIKELYVDEVPAPVGDILEKEKFVLQAHLAEANLLNLQVAISASVYSTSPIQITGGAEPLSYVMVGVSAPAPNGSTRVILLQKAITTVAVSMKITRKDKVVYPVSWDARQISGTYLFQITDLGTGYENS